MGAQLPPFYSTHLQRRLFGDAHRHKRKIKLNRSCAKKALQIKFFIELEVTENNGRETTYAKQLIWKFNPDGVPCEMPRDWARLLQHPLVISEANRETISGKGSLQSLDLRDSKTLHACFSQDRGSLIAVYKSARNINGIWDLRNGNVLPVAGKIKVVEGLRPGVVSVSWSYGHWAYGSNTVTIDGNKVEGDKRRKAGLCPNAVMHVDPVLKNVSLEDLIGGSASYYDSKVNLVKL